MQELKYILTALCITGHEIAPNTGANATHFPLWRPNPEN